MSKKKKTAIDREVEIQGAKIFGKHVSKEKGRVLLAVTTVACILPVVLGLRLWDRIPEIVETGLIGANGEDDSMPRWAVVYALPGLMCLLNLICHLQLLGYQKRMTVPPAKFRLVGRWGFPVISVLFCSGFIRECAGLEAITLPFIAPCLLGLFLMILGAQFYDCPEDAKVAMSFAYMEGNRALKQEVNRFAGLLWLVLGLLCVAGAMIKDELSPITALIAVAALAGPWLFGRSQADRI